MVLWSGCFCTWVGFLTRNKSDPRLWIDCRLYYFLFRFGRHYSSMLLVLMSIEKCFAVYFPLTSKSVCTMKTAKLATGIVGVVLAGCNSVYFILMKHNCLIAVISYSHLLVVDSVLNSFAPFILMFITNLTIVFKNMMAKCKRSSSESTSQALAKSATRGTAMVVTVSVTFIILTAPTAVTVTKRSFMNFLSREVPFYRPFMNVAQYLNHSIYGILYCIVGSKFRTELLKVIGRTEKPKQFCTMHINNHTWRILKWVPLHSCCSYTNILQNVATPSIHVL